MPCKLTDYVCKTGGSSPVTAALGAREAHCCCAIGSKPRVRRVKDIRAELVGREYRYTYEDGATVVLGFEGDGIRYRWLSGPFEGVSQSNLEYSARELRPNQIMINWHDPTGNNFVTLIFDLEARKVFSSGIIGYATDEAVTLFDVALIKEENQACT